MLHGHDEPANELYNPKPLPLKDEESVGRAAGYPVSIAPNGFKCYLLFRLAGQQPQEQTRRLYAIVLVAIQGLFLEVRVDPREEVRLYLGTDIPATPPFCVLYGVLRARE